MYKPTLTYRIFYWVPNTLSGERIAFGIVLFDKDSDFIDSHWLDRKTLNKMHGFYSFAHKADTQAMLNLMDQANNHWKSKAFNASFWNYIERYWNGIIQVSDQKRSYYGGTKEAFDQKSQHFRDQFLPLASDPSKKKRTGGPRRLTKRFEQAVQHYRIQDKVSIGAEIPEHGDYHLLEPLKLDLGAQNGAMIGSASLDFSLKTDTLIPKTYSYIQGFENIKNIEQGGHFSIVIHSKGEVTHSNKLSSEYRRLYDDLGFLCGKSGIRYLGLDGMDDLVQEIAGMEDLRPLDV